MKQAIVTCTDPNLLPGAAALLQSTKRHLPGRDTYVILCNPSRRSIEILTRLGAEILPVDPPAQPDAFSLATFSLLKLLPFYDQILFMSGDMLVISGEMAAIFQYTEAGVCAVPSEDEPKGFLHSHLTAMERPGQTGNDTHLIDTEMLLLNSHCLPDDFWLGLDEVRIEFFPEARTHEDLLNYYLLALHSRLLRPVPRKFNWKASLGRPPADCCALRAEDDLKPWHKDYTSFDVADPMADFARATAHYWDEYVCDLASASSSGLLPQLNAGLFQR